MHLPYKYFVALFYFTQEVILYLGCNFCSTDDFAYDIMNVFFLNFILLTVKTDMIMCQYFILCILFHSSVLYLHFEAFDK